MHGFCALSFQNNRLLAGGEGEKGAIRRRRDCPADQICVYVVADERQALAHAVLKTPHMLTVPKLVADSHAIELARFVHDKEGDNFDFHATYLIRIFS